MNFLCYSFFSTSAFTVNNYAVVSRTNQFDLLQYLPESHAIAKNVLPADGNIPGAILFIFLIICNGNYWRRHRHISRFVFFKCFTDSENDFVGEERFCDVVEGTKLHYLY